jgi:hypothetical protein
MSKYLSIDYYWTFLQVPGTTFDKSVILCVESTVRGSVQHSTAVVLLDFIRRSTGTQTYLEYCQ